MGPGAATAWTVGIVLAVFFLWPLLLVPHVFGVVGLVLLAALLLLAR
jgi:hypothetical protein